MEVLQLPVNRWNDYRDLRLRALKEDPEAFSSSYADNLSQPAEFWRRRLADALLGERNWLLFAGQEDALIGMIGAYVEQDSPAIAKVVSVYVPAEARGKGVSKRLMQDMLGVLSKLPALTTARLGVNVTQLAALGLYRRFGFVEVGSEPATTGVGQPVQQLIMERELPITQPERR